MRFAFWLLIGSNGLLFGKQEKSFTFAMRVKFLNDLVHGRSTDALCDYSGTI